MGAGETAIAERPGLLPWKREQIQGRLACHGGHLSNVVACARAETGRVPSKVPLLEHSAGGTVRGFKGLRSMPRGHLQPLYTDGDGPFHDSAG
jgi:hypothetical protein